MRSGQAAFEYLMIMGVAMFLIVPGTIIFYNYSLQSGDDLVRSHIHMIGNQVIDTVEKVYYIGSNSWETVKVELPDKVAWIYILDNSELVIGYNTQTGISEAVFFSDIYMTTPYADGNKNYLSDPALPETMHTGLTMIKITSIGNQVFLNETR
ncbi:hypothetical protein JXB28_00745 [Candidatus Woesearchaeota archaeon]|nr:hypothetical protein [Candidatus Woesearchaeota archaeon]